MDTTEMVGNAYTTICEVTTDIRRDLVHMISELLNLQTGESTRTLQRIFEDLDRIERITCDLAMKV